MITIILLTLLLKSFAYDLTACVGIVLELLRMISETVDIKLLIMYFP